MASRCMGLLLLWLLALGVAAEEEGRRRTLMRGRRSLKPDPPAATAKSKPKASPLPPPKPKAVDHPSEPADSGEPTSPPISDASLVQVTFPYPYDHGRPIDYCLTYSGKQSDNCGKATADYFCEQDHCLEATNFTKSTGDRGATYVAGDRVIKPKGGSSFDFITCSCPLPDTSAPPPSAPITVPYEEPKVLGHPLDYCLHQGSGCGQEAADAYCKSYGSQASVNFTKAEGVAGPTWIIGDHALNPSPHPDSFQNITCA